MAHWSRDTDTGAAAGEGEASPSYPLGWAVGKGDFLISLDVDVEYFGGRGFGGWGSPRPPYR